MPRVQKTVYPCVMDYKENPRISFFTFGCRVNQYETQMMRELLTPRFEIVSGDANVYVVNACTVTSLAERKARQAIHRLRRENHDAKIIVIGCVGDAVASGLSELDQVDLIAGNAWKVRVDEVIELGQPTRHCVPHAADDHDLGVVIFTAYPMYHLPRLALGEGSDRAGVDYVDIGIT